MSNWGEKDLSWHFLRGTRRSIAKGIWAMSERAKKTTTKLIRRELQYIDKKGRADCWQGEKEGGGGIQGSVKDRSKENQPLAYGKRPPVRLNTGKRRKNQKKKIPEEGSSSFYKRMCTFYFSREEQVEHKRSTSGKGRRTSFVDGGVVDSWKGREHRFILARRGGRMLALGKRGTISASIRRG